MKNAEKMKQVFFLYLFVIFFVFFVNFVFKSLPLRLSVFA